mgnify:CR=1 FL=1
MSHYKSNLRDIEFNLFEVFGGTERFGNAPFDDIDVDTAKDFLKNTETLATGLLSDTFASADRNPPVLHTRTRRGEDVQSLEIHPAYRELEKVAFGEYGIQKGDEIIISGMEHHSNIVPWQMLCARKGAVLRVVPIDDNGDLIMEEYENLLSDRTKIVAITHISNTLGTVNPVHELVRIAHARGVPILIDAAQAVQHIPVDVQDLDADFLAFSGHKLYGPSGVGVLHAKAVHLEAMPPYQGGGDMIERVSFAGTTWNEIPFKFEAGTPDIAGIVALGAAIDYVEGLGLEAIAAHEAEVLAYATRALNQVAGVRLIGTAAEKCSVLTFAMAGVHPQDLAALLDLDGIAIRTGHHCAMPLHERFGLAGSARASIGLYTTCDEIDRFVASLRRAGEMLQ